MTSKEYLMRSIRERKNADYPFYDVHDILEIFGMGMYGNICTGRIVEELLIDAEHVQPDYTEIPHIQIDWIGFYKCEHILESYLTSEQMEELEEALHQEVRNIQEWNRFTESLRDMSGRELREELAKRLEAGEREPYMELIQEELKCRKPQHKAKLEIEKHKADLAVRIKYHGLLRKIKKHARELKRLPREKRPVPEYARRHKWILLMEAYERMKGRYGSKIDLEHMSREDLLKYVYLSVEYCGKGRRRLAQDKTKSGIRREYEEASMIGKAVGMLTPVELQQMFPVRKEYKGERYAEKDYFYTMERLKALDPDKPLGDKISGILWDYLNHDITFFLIYWMNAVDDLALYCNESAPKEEFYKGMGIDLNND